jgi:hypothetical protein
MPVRRVSAIADLLPGSSVISHNSVDYAIAAPALGASPATPSKSDRIVSASTPRSSLKADKLRLFMNISSSEISDHVLKLFKSTPKPGENKDQITLGKGRDKILIKLGTGAILPADIDPNSKHWASIKSTEEFVSDEMDFFVDVHGVGKCSLHYLNRERTFKYIVANDEKGKKHLAKFVAIGVNRNKLTWPGYNSKYPFHTKNTIEKTGRLLTTHFYVNTSNYFGENPNDDNWVKFSGLVDAFLPETDVAIMNDRPTEQNVYLQQAFLKLADTNAKLVDTNAKNTDSHDQQNKRKDQIMAKMVDSHDQQNKRKDQNMAKMIDSHDQQNKRKDQNMAKVIDSILHLSGTKKRYKSEEIDEAANDEQSLSAMSVDDEAAVNDEQSRSAMKRRKPDDYEAANDEQNESAMKRRKGANHVAFAVPASATKQRTTFNVVPDSPWNTPLKPSANANPFFRSH